jgi:hypothetical protein
MRLASISGACIGALFTKWRLVAVDFLWSAKAGGFTLTDAEWRHPATERQSPHGRPSLNHRGYPRCLCRQVTA